MAKKAAVVIGVDKTGRLTPLKSAASGAEAVAKWLQGEGYDVECLTDKSGPVQLQQIRDAVGKFATLPARYSLLVVYFSGHGYWNARTDIWLLSGAATDGAEAINLKGATDLARYSGIPNVVFISDACRSLPNSRSGALVRGVDAFPIYDEFVNPTSKVDLFLAASEAQAAYEHDIDGEPQSILTYALRSAFKEPQPDMISEVQDGAVLVQVVPNRKLEDYLRNKVAETLEKIDLNLTQNIIVEVPSKDDVYIARAQAPVHPVVHWQTRKSRGAPATRVGRDAADAISRALVSNRPMSTPAAPDSRGPIRESNPAMELEIEARLPKKIVWGGKKSYFLESKVGLVLHGASVVRAVTTKGDSDAFVEILENGDGRDIAAVIRLWDVHPAVSVAIELEDGRCVVLAGLEGYIGQAGFDEEGLSNVSYVPSSNHWRWQIYENKKAEIDRLRALVSLAVKNNTFQIHSDEEADALGRTIRLEKSIDPTLGLYAAHAFSQAGNDDSVLSILNYMRGDLQADLFDVRTLASRHMRGTWGDYPLAPFCPMLTQTWNVLRPRGIVLPHVLEETVPYLCNSLWTTFQPGATEHIMQAIERGELK